MGTRRKIIHVDMDCFYAAIEVRDHPELAGRPVAVGGRSSRRGVLTTANYEARKFGCRSAMPTYKAISLCPQLIVMPVRFDAYHHESDRIREVFLDFTPLIEPLSLDEAYLDVSHLKSQGAHIAAEIRARIKEVTQLNASAGIAPNKFLAKIASDWNKPNGQFEVRERDVDAFMKDLPVRRIWGVGERTAEKLERLGLKTCGDIQRWSLNRLTDEFGKFGVDLYQLSRGQDDGEVKPDRERKSLSTERTFGEDFTTLETCLDQLGPIYEEMTRDLKERCADKAIAKSFVKLKFNDFNTTTAECPAREPVWDTYQTLLEEAWGRRRGRSVRLIGAGVRFAPPGDSQLELGM